MHLSPLTRRRLAIFRSGGDGAGVEGRFTTDWYAYRMGGQIIQPCALIDACTSGSV